MQLTTPYLLLRGFMLFYFPKLEMFEEAFIIKAVAFAPGALPPKYNNKNC